MLLTWFAHNPFRASLTPSPVWTHAHTHTHALIKATRALLTFCHGCVNACCGLSPSWWGQIWGDQSWGPARDRKRTSPSRCSTPQPAPPVRHLRTRTTVSNTQAMRCSAKRDISRLINSCKPHKTANPTINPLSQKPRSEYCNNYAATT